MNGQLRVVPITKLLFNLIAHLFQIMWLSLELAFFDSFVLFVNSQPTPNLLRSRQASLHCWSAEFWAICTRLLHSENWTAPRFAT